MIREVAIVSEASPYFQEWTVAAARAMFGSFPIVRATTDVCVDVASPTLFLLIGDVNLGGIPEQIRSQQRSGRTKRAVFVLWYTERLPLIGISCDQATRRWEEFQKYCDVYDAVLSVDAGMAEYMASQGVKALHAPVGYDEVFSCGLPRLEPSCDVLFHGEVNARRGAILEALRASGLSVHVGFAEWQMSRAYSMARARCYLNLHYDDYPMFEQLRFVHGIANRIPVVTETVAFPQPFVPGEHLMMAAPESLPGLISDLLSDGLHDELARRAFEFLTEEIPMKRVLSDVLAAIGLA